MKTPMQNRDAVKNESLIISVSKNEKEAIKDAADELGLTMSSYVRMMIAQSMKAKHE